jgi:hypothetical protein
VAGSILLVFNGRRSHAPLKSFKDPGRVTTEYGIAIPDSIRETMLFQSREGEESLTTPNEMAHAFAWDYSGAVRLSPQFAFRHLSKCFAKAVS